MKGIISATRLMLPLAALVLLPAIANATIYHEMDWTGTGGYTMQARFSYDETTAPTIITATNSGPTSGVETLDVTFRDPSGTIIQTLSNVVGGVSSYQFLNFSFDTSTGTLGIFMDVGKDDGLAGDIYLSGNPNISMTLFDALAGQLDTGGTVSEVPINADFSLVFHKMEWTGPGLYSMVARFSYDRRFAPPVISGLGSGPTDGIEYLEVSFLDPVSALLQTVINVDAGISSYGFLNFSFDTFTATLGTAMDVGKDDGIPGDLYLSGNPNVSMSLIEVGTGTIDNGNPVVVTLITDPVELNDVFADALQLPFCDNILFNVGTIDPRGDLDYFRVDGPPGLEVRINIDADHFGSPLDSLIAAFDSSFTLIDFSDDDPAPGELFTLDSYLDITIPPDGVVYILVTSYADFDFDGLPGSTPWTTGNYVMSVNCAFIPGRLYASTGTADALIEIDPASGVGTFLAPLGAFGNVTELEFDATGQLFGSTGGGASTIFYVERTGLTERLYCTHPFGAINGLEYINGVLYGTYIAGPGSPSDLVIVSPPPTAGGTCALTTIGPTGFGGIGGLAYDVRSEKLYGCTVGGGGAIGPPGMLVEIDLTTGAAVPVGAPNIGATACSALEYSSAAFGTESMAELYAGTGQADPAVPGYLFRVNAGTGTGTAIGPTGFAISGLAFAPGHVFDMDNDEVDNTFDNCTLVPNADQRDTNSDGFGNACDPDLNNDCAVNFVDLNLLKDNFFAIGDFDTDFDGDGSTNFNDLSIMKKWFFGPPGPSAFPCGIENASFETGDFTGWTTIDHPNPFYPLSVDGAGLTSYGGFFNSSPTDGLSAALHGFDGSAGSPASIRVGQDVFVVPATAVLRADYRVAWNLTDFCTGCSDRTFRLNIYEPGGGFLLDSRLIQVLPAGTTVLDSGNLLLEEDLSAFAGQHVYIDFDFEVPDVSSGPAFLQLDNVRFEAP